jgi:hypothetical protein
MVCYKQNKNVNHFSRITLVLNPNLWFHVFQCLSVFLIVFFRNLHIDHAHQAQYHILHRTSLNEPPLSVPSSQEKSRLVYLCKIEMGDDNAIALEPHSCGNFLFHDVTPSFDKEIPGFSS